MNDADEIKHIYLDEAHLLRICQGDQRRVMLLVSNALPILRNNITAMQEALAKQNDHLFEKELHQIKGSLGVIEPRLLYQQALHLETSYKQMESEIKQVHGLSFIRQLMVLTMELKNFYNL